MKGFLLRTVLFVDVAKVPYSLFFSYKVFLNVKINGVHSCEHINWKSAGFGVSSNSLNTCWSEFPLASIGLHHLIVGRLWFAKWSLLGHFFKHLNKWEPSKTKSSCFDQCLFQTIDLLCYFNFLILGNYFFCDKIRKNLEEEFGT